MTESSNQDNLKFSAVVVTYNRKDILRQCLQALLRQTKPLDEIIVVDNASTDGTEQMLRLEFPAVTAIRLPENLGGAGGFYEGMKYAYEQNYDWIWIMDDDGIPAMDALEQLVSSRLIHEPTTAVLACTVVSPNEKILPFHRCAWNPYGARIYDVGIENYEKNYFQVDVASFVGILVSRKTIDKVGLPLKELFISCDDYEYLLRIRNSGGRIWVVSKSRIIHPNTSGKVMPAITSSPLPWRLYYARRNDLYQRRKYGSPSIEYYFTLFITTLKSQLGVLLFRRHKVLGSKILWLSIIHGLTGRLGKYMDPNVIERS